MVISILFRPFEEFPRYQWDNLSETKAMSNRILVSVHRYCQWLHADFENLPEEQEAGTSRQQLDGRNKSVDSRVSSVLIWQVGCGSFAKSGGEMKVLIAEDDYTSRLMLKAALDKLGYEVDAVETGRAAWERMQRPDAPPLVVLDWLMPEMDGLDVCRHIRETESQRPVYVIMLSSRSEKGDMVEGLDAGADDYIAKPYNLEELRARVNVGRRMLELQNRLAEQEKLRGVLEMAGAICHELNQPLQVVSGLSELILMKMGKDDPNFTRFMKIRESITLIGELTRKIMGISRYRTKGYLDDAKRIIDIQGSSPPDGKP
jgi:CheY-like chemotaxis protein